MSQEETQDTSGFLMAHGVPNHHSEPSRDGSRCIATLEYEDTGDGGNVGEFCC